MAKIKITRNNKCSQGRREKGTLLHRWWECKLVSPPWETVSSWSFLKKIKNRTTYNPLLGIYPKDTKTVIQRDTCTPMLIAVLFTIVKLWKQPKCPLRDEWIKMWYVCVYVYIFSHMKQNEILPLTPPWVELKSIMISEIN